MITWLAIAGMWVALFAFARWRERRRVAKRRRELRPQRDAIERELRAGPWSDPTHGRIDRDIQEAVDEIGPADIGQRVAMENNMQRKRDSGAMP